MLAGGGTGGHIFPAIAIADEIKKIDREPEILFIGAKGRIEEKIVPANNYRLVTLDITGIDRKVFFKNLILPYKLLKAINRCREIIREFRPDVVIGTGGFVCGPVIYTANKMKIPTLIQEGNSFAGKTIKYLSADSKKVVINFDETRKFFKRQDNVIRISHPIRSSLKTFDRSFAAELFGLKGDKKTIFIFGGSQGAKGLNSLVQNSIGELYKKDFNIIWQTGKGDYSGYKNKFTDYSDRVKIYEFIENIDAAYSACDIIICRAGITSIMEIAFFGKPAVFVPLPASAENHQFKNAESLVSRNAAFMVEQNETYLRLLEIIMKAADDENLIEEMIKNLKMISDPDAAFKIAGEAIKLIDKNE